MLIDGWTSTTESRHHRIDYNQIADRSRIKAVKQRIDTVESVFRRKHLIYSKSSLVLILRVGCVVGKGADSAGLRGRFRKILQQELRGRRQSRGWYLIQPGCILGKRQARGWINDLDGKLCVSIRCEAAALPGIQRSCAGDRWIGR